MLKRNQPMLLERMGKMPSATDVAEYCKYDGFDGLKRAISLSDEEILNELDVAHLRGRGGAAYPLGKKWRHLYHAKGTTKYIVCNADEGEPGTFKDKVLLSEANCNSIKIFKIRCGSASFSRIIASFSIKLNAHIPFYSPFLVKLEVVLLDNRYAILLVFQQIVNKNRLYL